MRPRRIAGLAFCCLATSAARTCEVRWRHLRRAWRKTAGSKGRTSSSSTVLPRVERTRFRRSLPSWLDCDVIVAESTAAIQAAKTVTQTVPIVMATSADPVGTGLVANLNRPGGNITGLSLQAPELSGKRLQLLTEIVPRLARVAVLSNPLNPSTAPILEQTKAAAQSLGVEVHVAEVQAPDKFGSAFAAITSAHAGALIVLPDPLLYGQHPRVVTFTAASHLPTLFPEKEVAEVGGLMAYGPSIPGVFGERPPTWIKFSEAPSRAICQSNSQPHSSLS